MRAANKYYLFGEKYAGLINELAATIDAHAIAPAVAEATIKHESAVIDLRCQLAERDKRIAELVEALRCAEREKRLEAGDWLRRKGDPDFGGDELCNAISEQCEKLADEWSAILAKHGGAHE